MQVVRIIQSKHKMVYMSYLPYYTSYYNSKIQIPHIKHTYTFKFCMCIFNGKTQKTKDKNGFTLKWEKKTLTHQKPTPHVPRVKLKIQKSGLGGKRKINNLALSITKACQSASFKRNKKVYKDSESFYRTSGGLKK